MIVLVGAGGTGKTTLSRAVKVIRPDLYVTDGFSRPVSETIKRESLSEEARQLLISDLTYWANMNYAENGNVLTARSLIDMIAYTRLFNPQLDVSWLIEGVKLIKDKSKFFYLPIEFEQEDDGFRYTGFQEKEDQALIKVMDDCRVEAVTLTGSVEDRVSKMKEFI